MRRHKPREFRISIVSARKASSQLQIAAGRVFWGFGGKLHFSDQGLYRTFGQ